MGLGKEYWMNVIKVLRDIIPLYDKVNNVISLGKINKLRELGIRLLLKRSNIKIVLDAGSGYGNVSNILLTIDPNLKIIMLDPIKEMLIVSNLSIPKICAIFEYMPFVSKTFDGIICGYSFRDSIEYSKAIDEFARILKEDGRLVIVDLGKPDERLQRVLVRLYLQFLMPLIAFLIAGKEGLKFKEIYGTYKRLPRNKEMMKLLMRRFRRVEMHKILMGGAVIFIAYN